MTTPTLTLPPIDVVYEDPTTGDTQVLTVATTLKDRSAYEIYAHKHGWPTLNPMQHATFLWLGFLAWSALRRDPAAPPHLKTATPDDFFDAVIDVTPGADPDQAVPVNPTHAAPGHAPV